MAGTVRVLVGTRKGAFILESDAARTDWRLRGPFCETWPINHVMADPETGAIHAGGGNEWFGPAVWTSRDVGRDLDALAARASPMRPARTPIQAVWSLAPRATGALCRRRAGRPLPQRDGGADLRARRGPARPPLPAGLACRRRRPDPAFARASSRTTRTQIWVGISAAGVFHTADGGRDLGAAQPRHAGRLHAGGPALSRVRPVRALRRHGARHARNRLYQQNHCGMYRSDDGGRSWQSIEDGLPSTFGFPAAAHPRDPDTLFLVPLNGDIKGRYMPEPLPPSGARATAGRPGTDLRRGPAAAGRLLRRPAPGAGHGPRRAGRRLFRHRRPASLYASADEGETWTCLAQHLPTISSVETLVVAS